MVFGWRLEIIVADEIRRLLPDTRPILRNEILRTYDAPLLPDFPLNYNEEIHVTSQ
jgi:hypothetical protein